MPFRIGISTLEALVRSRQTVQHAKRGACMYICIYMVHEEREDERRRRGGWVVSSDLDPGNQVSSSQLHWHTFPRIYTVAGRSRPSTMTQPTTRRVTIARITSELSRPRQPVNRGRVTVIIETLLRDRSRRMESRPIP